MGTIWRRQDDEWGRLTPSEFDSEEKLHDLVESSPGLLPLSGNPSMVVLGREVQLGPGYADLLAVETDGRLVVIEIKLRKNAETRRAVVAQILTYAAYLKASECWSWNAPCARISIGPRHGRSLTWFGSRTSRRKSKRPSFRMVSPNR